MAKTIVIKNENLESNDEQKKIAEARAEIKKQMQNQNLTNVGNANTDTKMFQDLFLRNMASPILNPRRSNSDENKLLFKMEDVFKTAHPIARILRYILAENQITHAEFDERHRIFASEAGFVNVQINYHRNNIKKAMNRPKLSYQMFEQIVNVIFGYGLQDLIFNLIHPVTGEIVTYSLTKILEKGKELYGDQLPTIYNADGSVYMSGQENQ